MTITVSNQKALEALKVWYAIFTTIMDAPENQIPNPEKLRKLYTLRSRIKMEAPDLLET